ncbi:MAG: 4'-phosphopantetheinyl transferase family protein [Candidatus Rifleibacteriota bacterium]
MSELELPFDHADLWIFDFEHLTDFKSELENFLCSEEQKKLNDFKNSEAATTFFYSKSLTRYLLSRYLKLNPKEVQIRKREHGKPEVANGQGLHFNLSHSGKLICFVFSPVPCGIDIEYLKRTVDYKQIMKRFFSEQEIQSWKNNSRESRSIAFFRGWTRKEAFLKATGDGITGLSKCNISFEPHLKQALLRDDGRLINNGKWFFYEFLPEPDYICSLVLKKLDLPVIKRKFTSLSE